jgi:catechol 2,3-dioxygenase-like lactoylglutathione lyase family enzyme
MSPVIDHVNIVTRDLEGTARFFVDTFGFAAGPAKVLSGAWVDELTGYKNASATFMPLTTPEGGPNACVIRLLAYTNPASQPPTGSDSQPNQPGYRHIGFVVPDIDALYSQLKATWRFFSAPVLVSSMNLKTVYFVGPEQIIIQLTQLLSAPPVP